MSNRKKEEVFQLIKSLEKGEKRNFKLFVKRNSGNQELKIIRLFDRLDKMEVYNEDLLLKQEKSLKKAQLSNLKAHLYKQILSSLRVMQDGKDIENELHRQLEYAKILYGKGLINLSLRVLTKIKEVAKSYHQLSFLLQILIFEKKIELLHITRSSPDRAILLSREIEENCEKILKIEELSNLSLLMYDRYIKNGFSRNEEEYQEIRSFFQESLPPDAHLIRSFFGRLYLYQSFVWYAYIQQDFLMYYRYARKWVDLFKEDPKMIEIESNFYLKGIHNLLQALFYNGHTQKFEYWLDKLFVLSMEPGHDFSPNNDIQAFIYLHLSRINQHFLKGTFIEGLESVPAIEAFLEEYSIQIDPHRKLLFHYKIASLYFGAADFSKCIEYLNKIINWNWSLRDDLQCYARLLHLISHYELGHFDILDSLAKSAYRYMAKMKNLNIVEKEIFEFIRNSFKYYPEEFPIAFQNLLDKLKQHEGNPQAKRAFNYLDFISWLESKLQDRPVQEVIQEKYHKRMESL
ncbi:MAG: hypothetical protein MRZ79_07445 [Bacteroidia bacterium]|nr:hypothetical protein [Bacteroidia bacterium]